MCGGLGVVIQGVYPHHLPAGDSKRQDDVFQRIDDEVSHQEIHRFVQEKGILDRYYGALLWSGCFFGRENLNGPGVPVDTAVAGDIQWLGTDLADGNGAFWAKARAFILLAHSMSRDDLITEDRGELMKNFQSWRKWLSDERPVQHLRPNTNKPVWSYDPDFHCSEVMWLYRTPDRPFPELPEQPRLPLDEVYKLTLLGTTSHGSEMWRALSDCAAVHPTPELRVGDR